VKKQMARFAAKSIQSGMTIALDGGSSVLAVVNVITRRLRTGNLQGLNIITNFIPAAAELLDELSTLGAGDRDRLAQVFMIGGLTRPVSLTTIPLDFAKGSELLTDPTVEYDRILQTTGPIDVAFIGANGMFGTTGLGTHNPYETSVKRWFVENSKRRFILMDPTKLRIPQDVPFASFDDGLEIVTGYTDANREAIEEFAELIEPTASTFEVVK